MISDNDIILQRNIEEVAKRREANKLNYLKRKELGIKYPSYRKYEKKVKDITDEERARKLIEQKKRYSREQNERLRQYKIDNNILPKKSGRKPKSNLSNSSTEANPAMNENSTDIQNTVSESTTTSNDLPISEVKKITHRGLDLTIYKVLDDEKVDKDLYYITFNGQYCISYKELTKFCNYAVEIEEQHNITCD